MFRVSVCDKQGLRLFQTKQIRLQIVDRLVYSWAIVNRDLKLHRSYSVSTFLLNTEKTFKGLPKVWNCSWILGNSSSSFGISAVSLSNNCSADCMLMRSVGSFIILQTNEFTYDSVRNSKRPCDRIYGSNALRATPLQCSARLKEIYINSIDREHWNRI